MRKAVRRWALALAVSAFLASGAPAQEPVRWTEFRRGAVRTWEYRIYARKPGGQIEVLTRVHCRPDLKDTAGCLEALAVGRLSGLKLLPSSITFDKPGGRPPFWEIEGHVLDCRARASRLVFREYYDDGDELVTRADFREGSWKAWEGPLAGLGPLACE